MSEGDVIFLVVIGGVAVGLPTAYWFQDNWAELKKRVRRGRSKDLRALRKAKVAVKDMVDWKEQRRLEERQKWGTEFEELAGEPYSARRGYAVRGDDGLRVLSGDEKNQVPVRRQEPVVILNGTGRVVISDDSDVWRPSANEAPIKLDFGTGKVFDAHPVRMGKYVGHYVVRGKGMNDEDILLGDDKFTVLKVYSDGHYGSCPGDCDCPKWAKRF